MLDKNKNFYQNEKSLKDKYYKMRIGIYETYDLEPNKSLYKSIVSLPSFLIINSVSCYYLFKKHQNLTNVLERNVKFLAKFFLVTIFNYNVFNRRYFDEYPVNCNFYIENKFKRFMNSLVNPIFILEKDFLLLLVIFIPCLIYNKSQVDEMNRLKKEKIQKEEDEYMKKAKINDIPEDKKVTQVKPLPEKVVQATKQISEKPVEINRNERGSERSIGGGKFL
jgi:hypothetical protein